MINRFKLLQNIGRFNSDAGGASHELSKLTLIYADNAQEKPPSRPSYVLWLVETRGQSQKGIDSVLITLPKRS